MTLVLTKVTRDGIAMAADAALTESYGEYDRILIGASKLLAHQPSASCAGTWGHAVIPHPNIEADPISLEFVVKQFMTTAKSIEHAQSLSGKLVEWLNETFPKARGVIGIDIASVRAQPGREEAVIYKVMNADDVGGAVGRFRCRTVREIGKFDDMEDSIVHISGDVNANAWVDEIRAGIRNAMLRVNRPLPETAEDVAAWLAVMVRTVSDLYLNLRIGRTIGGPVSTAVLSYSAGTVTVR